MAINYRITCWSLPNEDPNAARGLNPLKNLIRGNQQYLRLGNWRLVSVSVERSSPKARREDCDGELVTWTAECPFWIGHDPKDTRFDPNPDGPVDDPKYQFPSKRVEIKNGEVEYECSVRLKPPPSRPAGKGRKLKTAAYKKYWITLQGTTKDAFDEITVQATLDFTMDG